MTSDRCREGASASNFHARPPWTPRDSPRGRVTASEPADAALEREKPGSPNPEDSRPETRPDPLLPPALPFEDDPAPGDPP